MIRDLTIRPAKQSDSRAIGHIYVISWRATYQGILAKSYLDGLTGEQASRSAARALTDPQALYLIAEDRQGPLGYIAAGPERGQDPIYGAEIYELYLLPDRQRQGLGRQLLDSMARRLHQANYCTLLVWVLARNPNRRFYERCGGIYLRTKSITHASRRLQACAYGWIDITLSMQTG